MLFRSTDNARCLIALCLMTGQVGRPGTGLHPLRGQNNVQGASDAGLIPMFLPDYQPVGRVDLRGKFEELWEKSLDPVRGLTVVEIMNAIHAGAEVRVLHRPIVGEKHRNEAGVGGALHVVLAAQRMQPGAGAPDLAGDQRQRYQEIGRASCRERV